MYSAQLESLFKYNSWANQHLLNICTQISTEDFSRTTSFPHKTIRRTMVHILFAEWIWRTRCEGDSPKSVTEVFRPKDYPTVEKLKIAWAHEDRKLWVFISNINHQRENKNIRYTNIQGDSYN